jgi:hypothetical protein
MMDEPPDDLQHLKRTLQTLSQQQDGFCLEGPGSSIFEATMYF